MIFSASSAISSGAFGGGFGGGGGQRGMKGRFTYSQIDTRGIANGVEKK